MAVVRDGEDWYAIHDECSHAAIPLSEGDVEGCEIECWLHGSSFDLRTGKPTGPPATEPVAIYPVKVDGDDVLVDVARAPTNDRLHASERTEEPSRMATLEIRDLHVTSTTEDGPKEILKGVDLDHQGRRDARDHGPERLRQVDAGLLDRRPPEVHRHRRHR